MSRRKKSFFERLTGSINVGDDGHDDYHRPEHSHSNEYEEFEDDFAHADEPHHLEDDWSSGAANSQEEMYDDEGELAVDVYETPEHIVVQAMVAGVRPDNLDVSITREMCTISGQREAPRDASYDEYIHRELYWGSFSRSVVLPEEVEVEEAEAKEDHGLLTIHLPKINKDRKTKLEIHSE